MDHHAFLINAIVFLSAAVIAVPLFQRLGLASVLGYLAAGSVIGPWGLNLITDVKSILTFSEFGVVFLLFIIGLELKPARLWLLRKPIFGVGGAQVLATSLPLFAMILALGESLTTAVLVSVGLAFSSTAFALQILAEKNQLGTRHGRSAFSILLFQDLAAIPLIASVALFAVQEGSGSQSPLWLPALKAIGTIAVVVIGGRYLLRPIFRLIARTRTHEIFTATALLLVLGVAFIMESLGLSMALGAFLAGVLVADSEYRHELEADIEPFKGLLLGLFFIAVGMAVDYGLIIEKPVVIVCLALGLLLLKFLVLYGLGRWSGLSAESSRHLAFVLPQGGEFAFVVFAAALAQEVMAESLADLLVVVVTLTMALTPLLVMVNEKWLSPRLSPSRPEFDEIESQGNSVIIAGFGRFGQMVGRTLRTLGVEFTALEHDPEQVEVLRKFGNKVYYGDASKLDLLRAAGADKARFFVLAIDDVEASLKTADIVRTHFPHLKILARARNRQHAYRLLDLGVQQFWRETLASSLEMTEAVLIELGFSDARARMAVEKFRSHDEQTLLAQHRIHGDEQELVTYSKLATQQLIEAMRSDLAAEREPNDL